MAETIERVEALLFEPLIVLMCRSEFLSFWMQVIKKALQKRSNYTAASCQ